MQQKARRHGHLFDLICIKIWQKQPFEEVDLQYEKKFGCFLRSM